MSKWGERLAIAFVLIVLAVLVVGALGWIPGR